MKSNIICISICVAVVLLLSLCACTATRKDEPTTTEPTTQPVTASSFTGGLTEKTYDPSHEESGDFSSLFGNDAAAEKDNAPKNENVAPSTDATTEQPAGGTAGLNVENNTEDSNWNPWF